MRDELYYNLYDPRLGWVGGSALRARTWCERSTAAAWKQALAAWAAALLSTLPLKHASPPRRYRVGDMDRTIKYYQASGRAGGREGAWGASLWLYRVSDVNNQ